MAEIDYDRLVKLDSRDHFSLRKIATHKWYMVSIDTQGVIKLTPIDVYDEDMSNQDTPAEGQDPGKEQDPGPTQQQIDDFNAAAAHYAKVAGIPIEEATTNLSNLLHNLDTDPVGTRFYFLDRRIDELEKRIRVLEIEAATG